MPYLQHKKVESNDVSVSAPHTSEMFGLEHTHRALQMPLEQLTLYHQVLLLEKSGILPLCERLQTTESNTSPAIINFSSDSQMEENNIDLQSLHMVILQAI